MSGATARDHLARVGVLAVMDAVAVDFGMLGAGKVPLTPDACATYSGSVPLVREARAGVAQVLAAARVYLKASCASYRWPKGMRMGFAKKVGLPLDASRDDIMKAAAANLAAALQAVQP